jgi:integral membrane sensor domain MASE1
VQKQLLEELELCELIFKCAEATLGSSKVVPIGSVLASLSQLKELVSLREISECVAVTVGSAGVVPTPSATVLVLP